MFVKLNFKNKIDNNINIISNTIDIINDNNQ